MEKDKKLISIARRLRKSSTDTERYLWRWLRNNQIDGFKFRRPEPIGRYIVDFVNIENKVIVELDGGQHAVQKEKDHVRDEWLKGQGYKVLRFWDNEVFKNMEGVLEIIRAKLLSPHPNPPPSGEGE